MSKVAVVANTEKLSKQDTKELRNALAVAQLTDVEWFKIAKGSEAKPVAAKALKRGATTVIVCGGDGSVRAASEALVDSSSALCVVPCGTANLFATGLGLPTDIKEIVELIVRGDRRSIDTGRCNGEVFNVMAGSGFDVALLSDAEESKQKLGTLAYVGAAARKTRSGDMFSATIEVDGSPFFDGDVSCVLVGNSGSLRGGIKAFTDATSTDGRLHVAAVTAYGVREWASLMVSTVLRRQQWSRHSEITEGKSITVTFDRKRRYELDGGVKGKTKKLKFEVHPRSLIVCASTD